MKFRYRITRWRRAIRKSQPEAAALLSVPVATYRNWEQGRNEPTRFAQTSIIQILSLRRPG